MEIVHAVTSPLCTLLLVGDDFATPAPAEFGTAAPDDFSAPAQDDFPTGTDDFGTTATSEFSAPAPAAEPQEELVMEEAAVCVLDVPSVVKSMVKSREVWVPNIFVCSPSGSTRRRAGGTRNVCP